MVALTEVAPAFRRRIRRDDVEFVSLHKPRATASSSTRGWPRLFRELRPAIVHTRNLAALECQVPAAWAGVPVRIHGEHGRDVDDLDGTQRPLPVDAPRLPALRAPLRGAVARPGGLPEQTRSACRRRASRRSTTASTPTASARPPAAASPIAGLPVRRPSLFIVGTVGRMQTVKAQTILAQAFVRALRLQPALRERLRLVMVGDGPLRAEAQATARRRRHGGPGLAARRARATCRMSCAGWIASCCRRWPKASRIPSWRRWPAACRCWPPPSAAMPNWWWRARPAGSCRRTTSRRLADRPGADGRRPGTRGRAWAGRGAARVEQQLQPAGDGGAPTRACTTGCWPNERPKTLQQRN